MKLRNVFLFLALTANVFCGFSAEKMTRTNRESTLWTESNQGDYLVHIVQKGETVYSIAANYSTTVDEIYRLNPSSEKGIKTGDMLRLPKIMIEYKEHKIESKETLYSVSKMYSLTIDDILAANTDLDDKNFKSGKKIRIPIYGSSLKKNPSQNDVQQEHKVEKGETLYSISKLYDIAVNSLINTNPSINDKGLKVGMMLIIPNKDITAPILTKPNETDMPAPSIDIVSFNIGILLPFVDEKGSIQKEKIAEYYEGFLLAVKDLKEKGLNANIYTFDIGAENETKRLESLLGTTELSNLNLIIGGVSKEQISLISNFAKKRSINYVVPFGTQNTDIKANPYLFQTVNSHSNLYDKISTNFLTRFREYNIIFVEEMGNDNNKSDFTTVLKNNLKRANILFKTIVPSSSLTNDLNGALDASKSNMLIPTSSSEITLKRIIPALKLHDAKAISLFGYPEWQAYTNYSASLHKYDTYIYSSFFFDENDNNSKRFVDDYKKWYNKKLINSYPKFGSLGYDTGIYFMSALKQYGKRFEKNINSIKTDLLQSAMSFEHDNSEPYYINTGLYFVHYKSDKSIEKIDCSK